MTRLPYTYKILLISAIILAFFFSSAVSAEPSQNAVTISVKDERTRETISGARVYFDGGYRGVISTSGNGVVVIPEVSMGDHTVRVTNPGYREKTVRFSYPEKAEITIPLEKSGLVPLNSGGSGSGGISIVFYPSSTSYNCTDRVKVTTPVYIQNETRFREDVMNSIKKTYLALDKDTDSKTPLPENYAEKFRFYYYFDSSSPADAFSGCTGTVPEKYWNEVTSSDITIILYPAYYGTYSDPACQPTGCFQDSGAGHSLMKVPANREMLIKHESGHAVFGLVDTYCGETYYYENDPYPNVWASDESCRNDAARANRDPEQCRRIQKSTTSRACNKDFWQWDPVPDIMSGTSGGRFGDAATQRIRYILEKSGGRQA